MKKVYLIGGQGFADELAEFGVESVQTHTESADGVYDTSEFADMKVDGEIDAVVVGWDTSVDYQKLCYAGVLLQMGKHFIASNPDIYDPMPYGIAPGTGPTLITLTTITGKEPEIIGKPYPNQVNTFMEDKGIEEKEKRRILVIGDRLDTDIALGRNASIDAALVLTGISKMEDVEKAEKNVPKYILESLKV
eukprot:TRINITY_DN13477_c0_g1_i11.p1 TRINITY_DN13477_c0_g1~~TRINITY_DN13477_c0_g1_i11.p1  ORF type:complete len:192 (-),score=66.52 TRINITY_DN13477_c0_g1_i11:170-745(-)